MFRPSKKAPAAEPASAIAAQEADAAFSIFKPYASLLLAVSGGSDSMALLHLAEKWRGQRDVKITVASVDHKLREGSSRDCDFVETFCAGKSIPFVRLEWEGRKPIASIQATARDARYKLLAQAARGQGIDAIVTAHTQNDQAETVLMRLIRGSGLSGLQAMKIQSVKEGLPLLRPLLGLTRERLRATLNEAKISWREDVSNQNDLFLRVRLRKLRDELAKKFARANDALDQAAQELLSKQATQGLELAAYRAAPEEIRLRALKKMIASIHAPAYPPGDEALEDLDAALVAGVARRTLGGVLFSGGERYLRYQDEKDPRQV